MFSLILPYAQTSTDDCVGVCRIGLIDISPTPLYVLIYVVLTGLLRRVTPFSAPPNFNPTNSLIRQTENTWVGVQGF